MAFENWKRERVIRSVLRKLSQQRVALILQPGNIWVVEKALAEDEDIAAALRTCHLRGWVEVVSDAIPQGELDSNSSLPVKPFTGAAPVYRLTEAGWNTVNRTHDWVVITFWVALATLIATITGVILSLLG